VSRSWDLARRCDAGLPVSCHLAAVEANGRIVADPIHKPTPAALRAEPKDEIERFLAATIANSSLRQKAYCDECLVTQTIGITLTRHSQCHYASRDSLPNGVRAPVVKFRESTIIRRVQYRGRSKVQVRVGIHERKELVMWHPTPPSAVRQERSDPSHPTPD